MAAPDSLGIRVIELADFVAGPYCGKLLADLGADVVKIEKPGVGDDARHVGPFKDDRPNPEASGTFLSLNTNKRSVEPDVETEDGRAALRALLAEADVLIEDRMPGELARLGLGYDDLHALNPNLIVTSITPFGQVGPFSGYKARHLNLSHASGQGYPLPMWAINLDVPPCQRPGYLGLYDGGMARATATLAALFWRDNGGTGQHIDVSIQHAMMTLERSQLRRFIDDGVSSNRTGKGRLLESLVQCSDGEFAVVILSSQQQWEGLWRAMGKPDWGMQPPFDTQKGRAANHAELRERLNDWARDAPALRGRARAADDGDDHRPRPDRVLLRPERLAPAGEAARDVYGVRVAPSAFGYKQLGGNQEKLAGAQHCRAEVWLDGMGWVAMDPADVLKVMRQERPEWIKDRADPLIAPVHAALFGSWEGNWVGSNTATDVTLPGADGKTIPFLMYPQGRDVGGVFDELAADKFVYAITAREA